MVYVMKEICLERKRSFGKLTADPYKEYSQKVRGRYDLLRKTKPEHIEENTHWKDLILGEEAGGPGLEFRLDANVEVFHVITGTGGEKRAARMSQKFESGESGSMVFSRTQITGQKTKGPKPGGASRITYSKGPKTEETRENESKVRRGSLRNRPLNLKDLPIFGGFVKFLGGPALITVGQIGMKMAHKRQQGTRMSRTAKKLGPH